MGGKARVKRLSCAVEWGGGFRGRKTPYAFNNQWETNREVRCPSWKANVAKGDGSVRRLVMSEEAMEMATTGLTEEDHLRKRTKNQLARKKREIVSAK